MFYISYSDTENAGEKISPIIKLFEFSRMFYARLIVLKCLLCVAGGCKCLYCIAWDNVWAIDNNETGVDFS